MKLVYSYGEDGQVEYWTGSAWHASEAKAQVFKTNVGAMQAVRKINRLFPDREPFIHST